MKTSKRATLVVIGIAVIVQLYLGLFIGLKAIRDYNAQQISDNLESVFDEVDSDMGN